MTDSSLTDISLTDISVTDISTTDISMYDKGRESQQELVFGGRSNLY